MKNGTWLVEMKDGKKVKTPAVRDEQGRLVKTPKAKE